MCEQGAHAHLIVVAGALQRGDLAAHQRLQIARAADRALDAVAHRGDLAANRLTERSDRLRRRGVRFREAQRDLRHGAGDQPHLLGAPRHHREHVEEHDRGCDAEEGRGELRLNRAVGEVGLGPAKPQHPEHVDRAEAGPHEGGDRREHEGRARGLALQRVDDVREGAGVVIGGGAAAGTVRGRALGGDRGQGRLGGPRRRRFDRLHATSRGRLHSGVRARRDEVQSLLDRRKGRFRGILSLIDVRHFRSPRVRTPYQPVALRRSSPSESGLGPDTCRDELRFLRGSVPPSVQACASPNGISAAAMLTSITC